MSDYTDQHIRSLVKEALAEREQERRGEEALNEGFAKIARPDMYGGDIKDYRAKQMTVAAEHHRTVLDEALNLYVDRSGERSEVWRRSGVRGQAFHLLAKAERAWQQVVHKELPNRDHFIDMINYAAFAVRLIDEAEAGSDSESESMALDGEWPT